MTPGTVDVGHEQEEHLAASGFPAVVLRPSFYMSNLLAAAGPVRHSDTLPAPAGTASISVIDQADVAAVAARVLLDDSAAAGVLHLTGPEALTYGQVARQLSDTVGRDITYVAPRLTGRPSGTLAEFARDHAAVFGDLVVR